MKDLLEIFNTLGVQYLIVGAHAVNSYTEARMTKDLDIWVNPTLENANKVYRALSEFGAPLDSVTEADFCDVATFYIIGINPNRIDILKSIPGLEFESVWGKRKSLDLEGLSVNLPALEDVLKAKLAAGRPQDLLDAEKLAIALKIRESKT